MLRVNPASIANTGVWRRGGSRRFYLMFLFVSLLQLLYGARDAGISGIGIFSTQKLGNRESRVGIMRFGAEIYTNSSKESNR
jgi:hypothetical protein